MKIVITVVLMFIVSSFVYGQNVWNLPFDDLSAQMEDPSIAQQNQAIVKNKIRKCTMEKWKSRNEKSAKLQSEKTVIYYGENGLVDSIIEVKHETRKVFNNYDAQGKLISRKVVTIDNWPMNTSVDSKAEKTARHAFKYDDSGRLIQEIIESKGDSTTLEIEYKWDHENLVSTIVFNAATKFKLEYYFEYSNKKIVSRASKSNSKNNFSPDKTNRFIYKERDLIVLTNTWVFASETPKQTSKEEQESTSEILDTKYKYYEDGKISSLQKVYGMWPGESFWISTFRYLENGLIDEKEMNNDSEGGHTKLIYKYIYE